MDKIVWKRSIGRTFSSYIPACVPKKLPKKRTCFVFPLTESFNIFLFKFYLWEELTAEIWFNFSSASAKRCVTHHDTALLTTELYMRWKRFTNWKILTNLTEDDCHSVCRNAIHYLSNSPIIRTTLTRTLINNHYDMTPGFKTITNLKGISKKKLWNWRPK